MPPRTLRLILGDQLNEHHSWFHSIQPETTYLIVESHAEATYTRHHIQKIVAFFLAMRLFAERLTSLGHRVVYLQLDNADNRPSIPEVIASIISREGYERFEYQLPDEYRLDQALREYCATLTIAHAVADTEHFYSARADVASSFRGKKQFLMETFYRAMRRKHNVLMDGNLPIGGQWNFDTENRKKLTNPSLVPPLKTPRRDVSPLCAMIQSAGISTIGEIDEHAFPWAVTRSEALEQLEDFCRTRLPWFGTYQDAMHTEQETVFHSTLSFALNVKLLSPKEVVDRAVAEWQLRPEAISLSQIEGFVRQILGWREYMRGLYWHLMPGFRSMNFFDHHRKLPWFYWSGETKMNCLKHAVTQSLRTAYAHHIQRLMITGNFALLAGIDPGEVDEWYLGIYLDALEWVQLPNTRGMSQFADGGIVASKPYISGSNYIHKMSNYCETCHYRRDLRHGDQSCPFNSLYWNFLDQHQQKLSNNPRLAMPLRTLAKFDDSELVQIRTQARAYLDAIERL